MVPVDMASAVLADPGLFRLGLLLRKKVCDDLVQTADKLPDFPERYFRVGRHKSVMPDFGEPVRQDVLEVAAHKLKHMQCTQPLFFLTASPVAERNLIILHQHNPVRTDGDPEDILRQVFKRTLSASDVTAVDDPVGFPHAFRQIDSFRREQVNKLRPVDF